MSERPPIVPVKLPDGAKHEPGDYCPCCGRETVYEVAAYRSGATASACGSCGAGWLIDYLDAFQYRMREGE